MLVFRGLVKIFTKLKGHDYYYYIDRRIGLNLSKSTQNAAGLKALKMGDASGTQSGSFAKGSCDVNN